MSSRSGDKAGGPEPLSLLAAHAPDTIVAFGDMGERTARHLLLDAARIARKLPDATPGSHVLLVFEHDRYALAASLLAALERGHAISLAPNSRADSMLAVQRRSETVAVAHDTDAGAGLHVPRLLEEEDDTAALVAPLRLRSGVIATVFTSGTTGPMTAWRKTSAELVGEAQCLARSFALGPGDRIVGSVPTGHIYGLLFTVLLPLSVGAAFSRQTPLHAEAVSDIVLRHDATALVSVPVQLRALARSAPESLAPLKQVFSSTGPLPERVALEFADRHGIAITEALGSTETGGIAFRQRSGAKDDSWQPFDEVRVSVSTGGRLCVDSPFLHSDLARPFETADLVEIREDGSFEHLGRADGIVKIGGHRVSVQAVEDCLRELPGVDDAFVVATASHDVRGHQLLAAVAPANCDPEKIRRALLKRFEPSSLPRRMRCVDCLPRETNGKISRERFMRLFDLKEDGTPRNWDLEWSPAEIDPEAEPQTFSRRLCIPADYAWFEGHFEGYPVLAGAVQLKEIILPSIRLAFPALGPVRSMNRVKFNQRILPGDELVVQLKLQPSTEVVAFAIDRDGDSCSSGTLRFSKPGSGQ